LETLALFVDGVAIGHLVVVERTSKWISGRLVRGAEFEHCRTLFEEAGRLSREVLAAKDEESSESAFEQPAELSELLGHLITIEGVDQPLKDFEVFDNDAVYVVLNSDSDR